MYPGHISFSADDIDLETYVTKNIKLKVRWNCRVVCCGVPMPLVRSTFRVTGNTLRVSSACMSMSALNDLASSAFSSRTEWVVVL